MRATRRLPRPFVLDPAWMRLALMTTLAVLILAAATAARAQLPPPQVLATVLFNLGGRIDSSALGPSSLSDPRWGEVGTHAEGAPSSSVSSFACMSNSNFSPLYGRGVGQLNFFFSVAGPTPTVPVIIDVAGAVTASASAGASLVVTASWELWSSPAQVQMLAGDTIGSPQASGSFADSFSHAVSLTLETNQVFFVRLLANAEAAATNPGSSAAAEALIDPVFRIGPGMDPALYTVELSAGIGNAPEPPALALWALGLVARCRRQLSRSARRASAMVS